MKRKVMTSLLLATLAACSNSDPLGKQTQVVAKVNGDEITVHQINGEMKRLQVPVANPQKVAKQMLGSLIDRQLLVQEAQKLNLDRTPEVMQLVDAARAQIYAQAYLARKVSALGPATEKEVQQFMVEHPEVFSHRKVFTTSDIIFANDSAKVDTNQLQTLVSNAEELKVWLNSHQIHFELAEETIPTEALPKQAVGLADQLKVGDLLFMHDDIKVVARSIANIADVPLSEQQAKDMATKAVNERKRQQLILDEVQRLKKLAQIEVLDPNLKQEEANATAKASPTSATDKTNSLDHGLKGL
ncbi:EpsD family peptidyl-prolyl cis-trans isomerase [Methylophilus sp. TWE2]|uniref:EpsD family peptidyl-prolyl cis-trans isomerase n=1 Tax=Methylophilus sp. TWE2 TaxID=1662285 RepID=UPI000670FE68|nr:EpsD family peptidyl-prolyl cis-trans isomerase [Methylophilus sp. TWE2]